MSCHAVRCHICCAFLHVACAQILCIWLILAWESLGSPARLHLVELGPGKGTLMNDIVRTAEQFPAFCKALEVSM